MAKSIYSMTDRHSEDTSVASDYSTRGHVITYGYSDASTEDTWQDDYSESSWDNRDYRADYKDDSVDDYSVQSWDGQHHSAGVGGGSTWRSGGQHEASQQPIRKRLLERLLSGQRYNQSKGDNHTVGLPSDDSEDESAGTDMSNRLLRHLLSTVQPRHYEYDSEYYKYGTEYDTTL